MKWPGALLLVALSLTATQAAGVEWKPESTMDGQLFPSLILATATVRPDSDEDEEEPDPDVLGDAYSLLGVAIKVPSPNAKVKLTVRENPVMHTSTWSGTLAKAGNEYYVGPKINYKFEQLRRSRQQVPLNVSFTLEVNGKEAGEQTETVTLRPLNDCPFGVTEAEETIADEEEDEDGDDAAEDADKEAEPEDSSDEDQEEEDDDSGYTDLGWMFAAYVNENSPIVQKILKEALATRIVNSFAGYQGDRDDVLREVFAIWKALQDRGIRYSNITTTAVESPTIYSQHVRFVDESLAQEQANCVDGSVLFCSILRKLGLRSFLVTVPGHMYMGVYLTAGGNERIAIETTVIGARTEEIPDVGKVNPTLRALRDTLEASVLKSAAWKTFVVAATAGTHNLQENAAKFEAEDDPAYQITDINEARADGVMPISYEKAD